MVAIVGRPNVGKSTFLNHALGYHLTAVSSKPQTTRQHWRGILSDSESQIIFIDTPGVHLGKTMLNDEMLHAVQRSLSDADLILCLCDPTREPGDEDQLVAKRVAKFASRVLLVSNKSDAATPAQKKASLAFYHAIIGDCDVSEMSALKGSGTDQLLVRVRERLPRGPFFYPEDQLTDAIERDIASELIREAALHHLREEVPHCLAVAVDTWQQTDKKLKLVATVFVETESQKGIVLGHKGSVINSIRADAIKRLREIIDLRIDLRLYVKVARDWRNRPEFLREHGLAPERD
ncbi:MAG: GTP-binding protein Era [Rhodothermales bacterium]|jgi:GTP-binding protein Era